MVFQPPSVDRWLRCIASAFPNSRSDGAEQNERAFVQVSVSDLGEGISDDVANRLFDSFLTTKTHGLGVGLSISRAIIEAHGGRIWFTRNASAGVTFHFTVPLARNADLSRHAATNASRPV
jgi:signal transduction histidine kinase